MPHRAPRGGLLSIVSERLGRAGATVITCRPDTCSMPVFTAVGTIMSVPSVARAGRKNTPAMLSVRVYDAGMVPAADQTAALRAAAGILAAAGIDVTWVPCADPVTASACATPLGAGELSARFVRLPAAVSAGIERWE